MRTSARTGPHELTALCSIKDAATEQGQLIRSVADQEMLHMQLAANLANAYGCVVSVTPPAYGAGIPHLDFSLDQPNPTRIFSPWSSDHRAQQRQHLVAGESPEIE